MGIFVNFPYYNYIADINFIAVLAGKRDCYWC